MPERSLSKLLEELLTDLRQEHRNLVLVFLLLKAGVVEEEKLGGLGQGRQVAAEYPWLLPLPFRFDLVSFGSFDHVY